MIKTLSRWLDSDVGHSFRTSPVAIMAAAIAFTCVFCSAFAGLIAPHNPFDLTTLELSDARLPPAWSAGGSAKYLLGTDDQGRDILSALFYGARISLVVGVVSVILSMVIGVALGLLAGFRGGWIDTLKISANGNDLSGSNQYGGPVSASRGLVASTTGMLYDVEQGSYGGGRLCLTADEVERIRDDPNTRRITEVGQPCSK